MRQVNNSAWQYHLSKLQDIDLLFPEGENDGLEARDHIFQISKLTSRSSQNPEFTQLFYEARMKTTERVWEMYSDQLQRDVTDQVIMSCTAAAVSTVVKAIGDLLSFGIAGSALAHLSYFIVYQTLTKYKIDMQMREADAYKKAMTFYPTSTRIAGPCSLNQRSKADRVWKDSMTAAQWGHAGAYYTTITGGAYENQYIAQAIVSPPNAARKQDFAKTWNYIWAEDKIQSNLMMKNLDFDGLNLDYFLMSSSLHAYNNKPYYSVEVGALNDRYNEYRNNTLGYIEQRIKEITARQENPEHRLNRIKPLCIDGRPQYMFVDGETEFHQLTLPMDTYYQPAIVSKERYDQLWPEQKDVELTVKARCVLASNTRGIDPYALSEEERELYAVKIPLSDNAFEYQISSVVIEARRGWSVMKVKEVSPSLYALDGGNLYFTRSLEEIVFGGVEEYYSVMGTDKDYVKYYDVIVKFSWIVVDSGSEEDRRMALAQATTYAIMDYFNQYVFAETTAEMIAEIGYTAEITKQSTIISTAFILVGGTITKLLSGKLIQAGIARYAVGAAYTMAKAPVSEVMQEVTVDDWIESLVEYQGEESGWTPDQIQFWSSALTSVRESMTGGPKDALDYYLNSKNEVDIKQDQELDIKQDSKSFLQTLSDIKITKDSIKTMFKNALFSSTSIGLAIAIPALFFGGLSLGAVSFVATDFIADSVISLSKYRASKEEARRTKVYLETKSELSEMMAHEKPTLSTDDRFGLSQERCYPIGKLSQIVDPTSAFLYKVDALVNYKTGDLALQALYTLNPQPFTTTFEIIRKIETHKEKRSFIQDIKFSKEYFKNIADERQENPASGQLFATSSTSSRRSVKVIDPLWIGEGTDFEEQPIQFNIFDLTEKGLKFGSAIRYAATGLGMDPKRPKVAVIMGQVVAPFTKITNSEGKSLYIDSTVDFEKVLEFLGYYSEEEVYDAFVTDAWRDDENYVIRIQYADEAMDENDIVSLEQWAFSDLKEELALMFLESNCKLIIKKNPDAFSELLKTKESAKLAIKLLFNIQYYFKLFHTNDLEIARSYMAETWKAQGREKGMSVEQLFLLESAANSIFDARILPAYYTENSNPNANIKKAMLLIIMKELLGKIDPDKNIKIHGLGLDDKDKIVSLLIQELEKKTTIGNPFEYFEKVYAQAVIACNFHISTLFTREAGRVQLRDQPIFYIPPMFDNGVDLESSSALKLLGLVFISSIKNGYEWNHIQWIEVYNKKNAEKVDQLLTGRVSYFVDGDFGATDVLGRQWIYNKKNNKWEVITIPSKNSQRYGVNAKFKSSNIERDLFREIFFTSCDIVKIKGIDMDKVTTNIILNGPMFNQEKVKLNDVDLFNLAVLENLAEQNEPGLTHGLSGYRMEILREEYTYWFECSKSQNVKKAIFEAINELIYEQGGYDSSKQNLDAFIIEIKKVRANNLLIESVKNRLEHKFGYKNFLTREIQIVLDELLKNENIKEYYGISYDSLGTAKFGLILKGSIGTYFETQEDFNQDGTYALAFRFESGKPVHKLVKLEEYLTSEGVKVLRFELEKDDIKAGWQLGVVIPSSLQSGTYDIYLPGIVALNGKKVYGRFDFDLLTKNIIDRGKNWYMTKNYWTYAKNANKDKCGIQVLNFLSTNDGCTNTFIYSRTRITSQFLEFDITLPWAEQLFKDESWILGRTIVDEVYEDEIIEIKGIERAKKVLTAEEFFQAYFNLIDFKQFIVEEGSRSHRERQPNPFLNGILGKLNVEHDIDTGEVKEETRREKGEIEAILNSLFDTEDQIVSFFFKKEENGEVVPVIKYDYRDDGKGEHKIATLKEWLEFVRDRIVHYHPSSNPKVEQYLKSAKEQLNDIQPLDVSTEKKRMYCSTQKVEGQPSELERTKNIFEVVKKLIGHSTLRYILAHNINFYGKPKDVSISITNIRAKEDLQQYFRQFGFYPLIYTSEGKGDNYIDGSTILKYAFFLYFGDSVIYLPIEGDVRDQSLNAVFLGKVPLSFLGSGIKCLEDNLEQDIFYYFKEAYEKYRDKKYGVHNEDSLILIRSKIFLESAYEAFNVIERSIRPVLEKQYKGKELENMIDHVKVALRIGLLNTRADIETLRIQLEAIINKEQEPKLTLDKVNNIKIPLDINEMDGHNIKVFQDFRRNYVLDTDIKIEINREILKNKVKVLKSIVEAEGGKVRIFFITNDVGQGFHYMGLSTSSSFISNSKYFKIFTRFGQQAPSYIDVDINKNPEILEKLVVLTMSYVYDNTNDLYRSFGLVIKKEGASFEDKEALCVINGEGFLTKEQLFSTPSFYGNSRFVLYHIVEIDTFEIEGIKDYDNYISRANKLWKAFDNYYPYDLSEPDERDILITKLGLSFE